MLHFSTNLVIQNQLIEMVLRSCDVTELAPWTIIFHLDPCFVFDVTLKRFKTGWSHLNFAMISDRMSLMFCHRMNNLHTGDKFLMPYDIHWKNWFLY